MAFLKNVYKDKGDSDSLKLSAKKHPVKGIVSTILAVLSLLLFVAACILAGVKNGKAPMYVGIMGFMSFIIAIIGTTLAWMSLREPDIRVIFPSIGGIINGLSLLLYLIIYIWGFYL